jgi:predicted glycoside hydrolase/deacetylase ChbG (UPF0249 family)
MNIPRRLLAVNADDFGFSRDVNQGIVDAHRQGILTSTTLMATGDEFEHALELARATPTLDIGVHFVLVGGPGQPQSVAGLVQAICMRRVGIYEELRRQMERIVGAGIRPSHLDTHKHTHLLPPVLDAVARLGEEYGVPWVRRPFDLPLHGSPAGVPWVTRAASRAFGAVRQQFHKKLSRHGLRTTDWFAGFQITGRYGAAELIHLLRHLPAGFTEFMAHPGYCTEELRRRRTRLKESRAAELRALTDPEVRRVLSEEQIELTSYQAASAST